MDRDEGRPGGSAGAGSSRRARLAFSARQLGKWVGLGLLAWVVVCVIVVSSIEIGCRGSPSARAAAALPDTQLARLSANLPDYARPEEDTYYSYPEWYIVWSYQEKATYQRTHLPGGFPYFRAIGQYWSSYCGVNRVVRRYPFSAGNHLMLVVIGTSFTVEYALKALYENTVGRITGWMSGGQATDEDRYAADVAQRYADFVLVRPFYEYSFLKEARGLWTDTPLFGRHIVRKWERKLFLTYDYLVEAFYCQLLEWATRAIFGVAGSDTYARLDNATDSVFVLNRNVRRLETLAPKSFLVVIPRYQEFTPTATALARQGVRFRDVAGNDGPVLISALAPRDFSDSIGPAELLFAYDVVIDPLRRRLVLQAPVRSLHTVLLALPRRGITIEHVYDF